MVKEEQFPQKMTKANIRIKGEKRKETSIYYAEYDLGLGKQQMLRCTVTSKEKTFLQVMVSNLLPTMSSKTVRE